MSHHDSLRSRISEITIKTWTIGKGEEGVEGLWEASETVVIKKIVYIGKSLINRSIIKTIKHKSSLTM